MIACQDNHGHFGYSTLKLSHRLIKQNARTTSVLDITFLHGLKIDCIIGVWDWERQTRQTIIVDLDMAADIMRAAASDDINDALDYKAVARRVTEFVEASDFQLVETLAEKIAALVLKEFNIPWIRVRINKRGAVRGARDVGVVIERGQQS